MWAIDLSLGVRCTERVERRYRELVCLAEAGLRRGGGATDCRRWVSTPRVRRTTIIRIEDWRMAVPGLAGPGGRVQIDGRGYVGGSGQ